MPRRIHFQRLIEKLADIGEGRDVVEARFDDRALDAKNGAADQGVLAARQLMIEPGAEGEDRRDPAGRL